MSQSCDYSIYILNFFFGGGASLCRIFLNFTASSREKSEKYFFTVCTCTSLTGLEVMYLADESCRKTIVSIGFLFTNICYQRLDRSSHIIKPPSPKFSCLGQVSTPFIYVNMAISLVEIPKIFEDFAAWHYIVILYGREYKIQLL